MRKRWAVLCALCAALVSLILSGPAAWATDYPACSNVAVASGSGYVRVCDYGGGLTVESKWQFVGLGQFYAYLQFSGDRSSWSTVQAGWTTTGSLWSYDASTTPPSDPSSTWWRFVDTSGTVVAGGGPSDKLVDSGPPPSDCEGAYTNLRASITDDPGGVTRLRVAFGFTGTVPLHGWRIRTHGVADDPDAGTSQGVVDPGERTQYGELWWSEPLIGTGGAGTVVRVHKVGHPDCYALVEADGTAIVKTPPDGSNGGDGSTATTCGFFDIPCYLKAVFVPSEATITEFTSMRDTLVNAVPFGYAYDAVQIIGSFVDNPCPCNALSASLALPGSWFGDGGTHQLAVLDPNGALFDKLQDVRGFLSAAFWLVAIAPIAWYVWRRMMPVVE